MTLIGGHPWIIDPLLRNQSFDAKNYSTTTFHSAWNSASDSTNIRQAGTSTSLPRQLQQRQFCRVSRKCHYKGPETPLRHDAICSDEMQRKIRFLNFFSPTIWIASKAQHMYWERNKRESRQESLSFQMPMLEEKGKLIFRIPFLTRRFRHALLMKNKRIDS